MSDRLPLRTDRRWSPSPGPTGARLPARLRKRRALLVPPAPAPELVAPWRLGSRPGVPRAGACGDVT